MDFLAPGPWKHWQHAAHAARDESVPEALRCAALLAIGHLSNERGRKALEEFQSPPGSRLEEARREALAIWQRRANEREQAELAKRQDEAVRERVWLNAEYAWKVLVDRSESYENRERAATALGELKHKPAQLDLIAAMGEDNWRLAFACSSALHAFRSQRHMRRVVAYLKAGTPTASREAAIYTLWWLREKRGQSSIARIALDTRREATHTRQMAAEALGNTINRPRTARIVAKLFQDEAIGVRKSALCAAGLAWPTLPALLRRAMESRLNDPEEIYGQPFGEQVREVLEEFERRRASLSDYS